MTDRFTDRLATMAASRARTPAATFVNRLSRLVVDPERFPDEREPLEAIGMGAVYRVTSSLRPLRERDSDHQSDLLERYFHPLAERFADLVDDTLGATGRAVIVDLHSYPAAPLPYEVDPTAPRPQVCLGIDSDHTPRWLVEAAREAFDGFEIGVNTPFAGTYVPLRHYRRDPRVASVMVELRRDTYATEPTGPAHAGFDTMADRLARLFELAHTAGLNQTP